MSDWRFVNIFLFPFARFNPEHLWFITKLDFPHCRNMPYNAICVY